MVNKKDKMLLEEMQDRFPFSTRPYHDIAVKLGMKEREVLKRTRVLKQRKIIRYIGPVFDPGKLKLVSCLAAAHVPDKKLKRAAAVINKHPFVSHNYLRDDEFNVWFTVSAPSVSRLKFILAGIKKDAGLKEILYLPAVKLYKIDARFKI
ncbi:MAG: Lrp/AsnC family transcriptional regulator [Candidatus Omnitrophica bacterium]|nr:Lrp/AsnC family transcriptional regulator [Candidatus Omnitrophota bacterium]